MDFDLNASLKQYLDDPTTIQTPEADSALLDCNDDADQFTNGFVGSILNPIVDSIAGDSESVARSSIFDSLQCLLKYV